MATFRRNDSGVNNVTTISIGYSPTLPEVFSQSWLCFASYFQSLQESGYSFPESTIKDIKSHSSFGISEALSIVVISVLLTFVRWFACYFIFQPWGRWAKIESASLSKMPESGFKLIFYTSVWIFNLYILFYNQSNYFYEPWTIWDDWYPNMPVPTDIQLFYMIQMAYYCHAMYATLFMDVWRKDSEAMLFHHVITLFLTLFSYSFRYHIMGVLITFFHDGCDVFLELSKLVAYFKIRNGKVHRFNESLSLVTFSCFTVSWVMLRLYWYPLKALWAAQVGLSHFDKPFAGFLFVLVWLLQGLNFYWFYFLIMAILRMAKTNTIEDVREYEELPQEEGKRRPRLEKSQMNGVKESPSSNGVSEYAATNGVKDVTKATNGLSQRTKSRINN